MSTGTDERCFSKIHQDTRARLSKVWCLFWSIDSNGYEKIVDPMPATENSRVSIHGKS